MGSVYIYSNLGNFDTILTQIFRRALSMPRKPFMFSGVGVSTGLLCLATLFLIEMFGPGANSSSGSADLMANGAMLVSTGTSSILPLIAKTAFATLLVPLILGAVGIVRKENIYFILGSFFLGLAPILIYTTGVVFSSLIYFGISLSALGIYALTRTRTK